MQKYNNGQALYFIDFPGYQLLKAVNKIYEPSTGLYRINYKLPGDDVTVMFNDVPESQLITLPELMTAENSINHHMPEGFKQHSVGTLVFISDSKIYVGTLNFAGQWKDYNSDAFIDNVTHWLQIEGFPDIEIDPGNARFYAEGEDTDPPTRS
jgi:hypothetical protein